MKTVRMTIDPENSAFATSGHIDADRVDSTTEDDVARQKMSDAAEAMMDGAKFARRVRRRLGFSQSEFANRIGVSLDTIRISVSRWTLFVTGSRGSVAQRVQRRRC